MSKHKKVIFILDGDAGNQALIALLARQAEEGEGELVALSEAGETCESAKYAQSKVSRVVRALEWLLEEVDTRGGCPHDGASEEAVAALAGLKGLPSYDGPEKRLVGTLRSVKDHLSSYHQHDTEGNRVEDCIICMRVSSLIVELGG